MADQDLKDEDLLAMSDDDIMKMMEPPKMKGSPGSGKADEADDAGGESQEADQEEGGEEAESSGGENGGEAGAENDGDADPDGKQPDQDADAAADSKAKADTKAKAKAPGDRLKRSEQPAVEAQKGAARSKAQDDTKPAGDAGKEAASPDGKSAGKDEDVDSKADAKSGTPVDYKSVYDRIMAPFKANGKTIKVDTPDDVIQLMKMGANYTRKIQALQPSLKVLRMLENHGLLDESKLSFLIDLHRKEPGAVKKMVKDSGVDPMDIDTTKDPEYKPGDYRVTDQEVAFTSTIQEIGSDQGGRELIRTIQQTWDKNSKDAIWKDPDILRVVNEQRQTGIYGQITAEIERRKTLGRLRPGVPFLEAYKTVGQEMQQSGALLVQSATAQASTSSPSKPQAGSKTTGNSQAGNRRIVDQRAGVSRKPSDGSNVSDRVRAASAAPSSASKGAASKDFNPLSMSDEDFEKTAAAGRRF